MNTPGLRASLPPVAIAAVLTLVVAWPVLVHPTERAFGTEIVGRHHDPYTVMAQFGGAGIAPLFLQPATDWTGRIFARVLPPVAAYNAVILMTFPLAALCAFLLAYDLTRSRLAAAVAALAFAFSPFHLAHAAYHPHVAQVQWLPLYFLALWRCVHGVTWARIAGLAAAAGLAVLANDYHGLLILVMTPAALVLCWLSPDPVAPSRRLRDLVLTGALLAGGAAAAFTAVRLWLPAAFADPLGFTPEDVALYSAHWWSYLVPPVDHPLLGVWARRQWASAGVGPGLLEQQVYVGWTLLVLAGVSVVAWLRREQVARPVPYVLALAAMAFLCSLPPDGAVPALSGWLAPLLPMFRSYARFGAVVQLLLALAAGIGAAALWNARGGRLAAGVVLALVAADYGFPHTPWRDVLPTSAHRWLAREGGRATVFDCTAAGLPEAQTSWLAGYPIGRFNAAVPDCGEPGLPGKLSALGYRYVVLRGNNADRQFLGERPRAGLQRVYQAADGDAYVITASPDDVLVLGMRGFYRREYGHGDTWRWIREAGALTVVNRSAAPREASLTLQLGAFGGPRHVTVTVDGLSRGQFIATDVPQWFTVGPVGLTPGPHTVGISSAEGAVTPASLGQSGDDRPLSLTLLDWSWRLR